VRRTSAACVTLSAVSPPAPPSLPAAVLWDMDGTLVDTEHFWFAAEGALVRAHDGTWTQAHAEQLVGSNLAATARTLREAGVTLSDDEIVEHLLDEVMAAVERDVPWCAGARELLMRLRQAGVPCALVTSSYTRLADPVVAALPDGTFDVVVTGDTVEHGKPHPEPYLTAAERLGAPPDRCVAIEDSDNGARSAEAAGVRVLVVENHVAVPGGPGRTHVASLDEVWDALTRS
jgi:HAD superfamily hydrolase (TIGR01509 family)